MGIRFWLFADLGKIAKLSSSEQFAVTQTTKLNTQIKIIN